MYKICFHSIGGSIVHTVQLTGKLQLIIRLLTIYNTFICLLMLYAHVNLGLGLGLGNPFGVNDYIYTTEQCRDQPCSYRYIYFSFSLCMHKLFIIHLLFTMNN